MYICTGFYHGDHVFNGIYGHGYTPAMISHRVINAVNGE
jgi:hypothetical protein